MITLVAALVVGLAAMVIVPMVWHRGSVAWLGAVLTIGLVLPHGVVAAVCTLPWLALVIATASRVGTATRIPTSIETAAHLGAHAFLIVGAGSATIAAAGWRPLGFAPLIIILTAAHFHYAGFAFGMIASRCHHEAPSITTALAIGGWLVGVPLVAIGIAASPAVEPWGAVIVAAAGTLLGGAQLRAARRHRSALLLISGLSIIAAMVLAAGYGLAQRFGFAWLDIVAMERIHGIANALGFALCGVLGWARVDRDCAAQEVTACVSV